MAIIQSTILAQPRIVSSVRPPASLSNASPDVKILILEQLAGMGWWPPKDIRSMSKVNREFAALSKPYLWGCVNFRKIDPRDLLWVLTRVLPHHVLHVTTLNIIQIECPRNVQIPSSSFISNADAALLHSDVVLESQLYRLLVRAIGSMTNLSRVRWEVTDILDTFDNGSGGRVPRKRNGGNRLVAGALAELGARLMGLKLVDEQRRSVWEVNPDQRVGGGLAGFLFTFPSLTHLNLNVHVPDAERESLVAHLSSLRHLQTLELTRSHLLDHIFAAASPWVCPLERLLIQEFSISSSSLFTFLAMFSTTLKSLTVSDLRFRPGPTPIPLPHLRTLDITANDTDGALDTFPPCPLRHLTLGDTASAAGSSSWVEFVESRVGPLQCVRISVGPCPSSLSLNWRPLRELCKASGIKCQVGARRRRAEYEWEDEEGADIATGYDRVGLRFVGEVRGDWD